MTPGSVVVDLAAEQGGNCELDARRARRCVSDGVTDHRPGQRPLDARRTTPA